MLIIEFVKITLESQSPQIKARKTRRHKKITYAVLAVLFMVDVA
jgi:uncharacterized membrane protein affecting hemolysin expression